MSSPAAPGKSDQPSLPFKLLAGVGFAVVCVGLFAPNLFRSGTAEPPAAPVAESTPTTVGGANLGWSLGKMLLGVGAVAVACVGVTRYLDRRNTPTASPNLEVLASLPVDGRCVVHLVRAGDRRLLVGVDATGVKAVTELPGEGPRQEPPVIGPVRIQAPFPPGKSGAGGEAAELFQTLFGFRPPPTRPITPSPGGQGS